MSNELQFIGDSVAGKATDLSGHRAWHAVWKSADSDGNHEFRIVFAVGSLLKFSSKWGKRLHVGEIGGYNGAELEFNVKVEDGKLQEAAQKIADEAVRFFRDNLKLIDLVYGNEESLSEEEFDKRAKEIDIA